MLVQLVMVNVWIHGKPCIRVNDIKKSGLFRGLGNGNAEVMDRADKYQE
jgi:hypothetical protein